MSRFIKLTNIIINTTNIATIKIHPTKYTIFMRNNHIDGCFMFGSGFVDSQESKVEVCKDAHPKDYQILEKWVNVQGCK